MVEPGKNPTVGICCAGLGKPISAAKPMPDGPCCEPNMTTADSQVAYYTNATGLKQLMAVMETGPAVCAVINYSACVRKLEAALNKMNTHR
jgi:hypothetical protein